MDMYAPKLWYNLSKDISAGGIFVGVGIGALGVAIGNSILFYIGLAISYPSALYHGATYFAEKQFKPSLEKILEP